MQGRTEFLSQDIELSSVNGMALDLGDDRCIE